MGGTISLAVKLGCEHAVKAQKMQSRKIGKVFVLLHIVHREVCVKCLYFGRVFIKFPTFGQRTTTIIVLATDFHRPTIPLMRPATLGLFLFSFFSTGFFAHASSVDSVRAIVTPVQCYGLRNGVIQVDTVFGGERPFFYSLDGQTFTTNPTFDHLWAGEYMLYVRDASGGTKNWPVKVKEPAELQVKLLVSETTVVAGEPLYLRAVANVETDFLQQIEWRPPSLFTRQDTLKQTVTLTESTQFAVIVHDQNGCVASDAVSVEVEQTNIYFPNVIKPGSASDAYFTVFAGEGVRRVISLQIYSRGGSLVFERLDFPPNAPLEGWGGRWDGKTAQSGVYPYLAVVEFWDGKQVRYEGTVTVVN